MADAVKLWKVDAEGPYLELLLGQKKDISLDLVDYWPGEALNAGGAVWAAPVGVTISGNVVNALTAKCYVRGDAAGEYACSLIATSVSGNYIEPFRFRVIVR